MYRCIVYQQTKRTHWTKHSVSPQQQRPRNNSSSSSRQAPHFIPDVWPVRVVPSRVVSVNSSSGGGSSSCYPSCSRSTPPSSRIVSIPPAFSPVCVYCLWEGRAAESASENSTSVGAATRAGAGGLKTQLPRGMGTPPRYDVLALLVVVFAEVVTSRRLGTSFFRSSSCGGPRDLFLLAVRCAVLQSVYYRRGGSLALGRFFGNAARFRRRQSPLPPPLPPPVALEAVSFSCGYMSRAAVIYRWLLSGLVSRQIRARASCTRSDRSPSRARLPAAVVLAPSRQDFCAMPGELRNKKNAPAHEVDVEDVVV